MLNANFLKFTDLTKCEIMRKTVKDNNQNSRHDHLGKIFFEKRDVQFSMGKNELQLEAPFPKNALIELSNLCNHACLFCKNPDQSRAATQLDIEVFKNFVSQAVPLGLKEIGLYATGEPFMTKDIAKYIAVAKKNGVERVYITTNGALATLQKVIDCFEAGLSSIKFSINASNALDYLKIHGFDDFDKVLENVKEIYKWKLSENIPLQLLGSCVIIPAVKHTKDEHAAVFSSYFEDIQYVNSGSQGGQAFQLPFADEHKSAVFWDFDTAQDNMKPCQLPWNRVHLTAEGFLTACCVDYDLDLVYGDMNKDELSVMWNNNIIKMLRGKHINDQLEGLLCDQCMNNRSAPYAPLSTVNRNLKSELVRNNEQNRLLKRFIEIKQVM